MNGQSLLGCRAESVARMRARDVVRRAKRERLDNGGVSVIERTACMHASRGRTGASVFVCCSLGPRVACLSSACYGRSKNGLLTSGIHVFLSVRARRQQVRRNRAVLRQLFVQQFFSRRTMSDNDPHGDGDRARPKHDGSRGASFRSYKRDFLTTSRGKFAKDDRYSFFFPPSSLGINTSPRPDAEVFLGKS